MFKKKILPKLLLIVILAALTSVLAYLAYYHYFSRKFTILPQQDYFKIVRESSSRTENILHTLPEPNSPNYVNKVIIKAKNAFLNTPYRALEVEGEGDWCSGNIKQRGCFHIKQSPIYRTDQFVCNTYVTQILAFIGAKNLNQYNKNILSIKYGAANQPASTITYYNRNNFISSDYNRINEQRGLFRNGLKSEDLKPYVKTVLTTIDRQSWFANKQRTFRIPDEIRVFNMQSGREMRRRFNGNYPLPFYLFKPVKAVVDYIPKTELIHVIKEGKTTSYRPNIRLLNQLPTPSVMEIVRDDKKWFINGKNIRQLIGSGIAISHMGFLYRQHFNYQQPIYNKISCQLQDSRKICEVTKIRCKKKSGCNKLMLTHATEAYPKDYYYFKGLNGRFHCQPRAPVRYQGNITFCNRVIALPLADYLMMKEGGIYKYMTNPAILGIHLEKIQNVRLWQKFR